MDTERSRSRRNILVGAGLATTAGLVGIASPARADPVYIEAAEKGAANGVAPLDSDTKIPVLLMPTLETPSPFASEINTRDVNSRNLQSWIATDHGVLPGADQSGQQGALQTAMSELSAAGGGSLVIPRGAVVRVTGTVACSGNVRLVIEPGAKLLKDNAGGALLLNANGIDNFSIEGGGTIDLGPRTIVTGSTPVNALRFTDCTNVTIRDIHFVNCAANTIYLRGGGDSGTTAAGTNGIVGCADFLIENCVFEEVKDRAVDCSAGFGVAPARRITIRNCRFKGMDLVTPTQPPWSILFFKAHDVVVDGNRFEQSDDTAVMFGDLCSSLNITNNVMRTKQVCLFLGAVTDVTVSGNSFTSTNDMGIAYRVVSPITAEASNDGSIVITGNRFIETAKPGILAEGGNEVIVSSNHFRGCGWKADSFTDRYKEAIGFMSSGSMRPDSIVITNNVISKPAGITGDYYGIRILDSPTNLVVQGNVVSGDGYTAKYNYGTLAAQSTFELQTDVSQSLSSKALALSDYSQLVSQTPTARRLVWLAGTGPIYGDGTAWRKVVDGTTVTP